MVPTKLPQENKKTTSFMNNVLIVLVAQLAVKFLGMIYRLVITNIPGFGDAGNGFYSAGYQVYVFLLALSSQGIPNAIAKLISERTALGDHLGAHRLFKSSLRLFSAIGLGFGLILFFGADFIATTVIGLPGAKYTMMALAPALFFVCVSSVIRGYFQGLQDMKATSGTQVLEQIFNCTFTIVIVLSLSGMSAEYMAAGGHAATSISCALSLLFLIWYYKRKMRSIRPLIDTCPPSAPLKSSVAIRRILAVAIPISLSSIVLAINRIVDTATITRGIRVAFRDGIPGESGIPTLEQLTDKAGELAGMLSKSDTLINLALALNVGFVIALIPAVTALLAQGKKEEAYNRVSFSLLLSILIILPCALGFIVLAEPIYSLLYPNARFGWDLLQGSAIALIFIAMNNTIYSALQGIGKIFVPAIGLLCGGIAKAVLNVILIRIPSVNIYGAVISSIVCQMISFTICFVVLNRTLPIRFRFQTFVLKPLLAGLLMSVAAWGTYHGLHAVFARFVSSRFFVNAISVAFAIVVAVLIYLVSVILLRILTKEEWEEIPLGRKIVRFMK